MKMYYVTLENDDEARAISYLLLEQQLAVCTNWFPINCLYRWQGEIKEEPEVVLIIKTKPGMRKFIEEVIAQIVDYTNCIAEIDIESVNQCYLDWLGSEVLTRN